MARAIQMSLPGLVKVVTDKQEPGRQLLTAIVRHSSVNPRWLLTAEGPPFTSASLPIAHRVLPGPPLQHPDLLAGEHAPDLGDLYSTSRYFLKVSSREPLAHDEQQKVKPGDLVLLETDTARFEKEQLYEQLAAIRVPRTDPPQFKLAQVSFYAGDDEDGPDRLEADTFDLGPTVVTETIIHERPGSEPQVFRRRARLAKRAKPGQLPQTVPVRPPDLDYTDLQIAFTDIVAVAILIVRTLGWPLSAGRTPK
jgi:hypothetical protein